MNGDVAPDLYLVRGQQYTFIVEGGLGTDQDGIIHPFYLTSDNEVGHSFSRGRFTNISLKHYFLGWIWDKIRLRGENGRDLRGIIP